MTATATTYFDGLGDVESTPLTPEPCVVCDAPCEDVNGAAAPKFRADGAMMHETCDSDAYRALFVYGTLRRGGTLVSLLHRDSARVGATIAGAMFEAPGVGGAYPAVSIDDAGTVRGEVVFIDRDHGLAMLLAKDVDAMERGAGYVLRQTLARLDDGRTIPVDVYDWPWRERGTSIDHGDWLAHRATLDAAATQEHDMTTDETTTTTATNDDAPVAVLRSVRGGRGGPSMQAIVGGMVVFEATSGTAMSQWARDSGVKFRAREVVRDGEVIESKSYE